MDESVNSLLEDVRVESISSGNEQSSIEQPVESILEEQVALRKRCEELSQEIQELQEYVQQMPENNVALYVFGASLIISILVVLAFVFLKKHLKDELYVKGKSSDKKIAELNKEIQRLDLMEGDLYNKLTSSEEIIIALNREIQRLNSVIVNYKTDSSTEQKKLGSEFHVNKVPPPENISFTDEYNALLDWKEAGDFSERVESFRRKYKIIVFFCSNSQELIQDSDVLPTFKESSYNDSDDYWAYDNGSCYEVVPSPYVQSYTNSVNIGRGFGNVFESNFKFGGYFTSIKVKTPAKFKKIGTQWILKSRGTLVLKQ